MATKLVNAKIPANTVCPFRERCLLVESCPHLGMNHPSAFSCATARGFDLMNLVEAYMRNHENSSS